MVETAVPVDVLSQVQRVYGIGLAEMRNKFGARVEAGGSSAKVGVQVRSVVASGTYEEVLAVRETLIGYKGRAEGRAREGERVGGPPREESRSERWQSRDMERSTDTATEHRRERQQEPRPEQWQSRELGRGSKQAATPAREAPSPRQPHIRDIRTRSKDAATDHPRSKQQETRPYPQRQLQKVQSEDVRLPPWMNAKVESHIARPCSAIPPWNVALRHLSGKDLDADTATLEMVVSAVTWEEMVRIPGGVEWLSQRSGGARLEVGEVFEQARGPVKQQAEGKPVERPQRVRSLLLSGSPRQVHSLEQGVRNAKRFVRNREHPPTTSYVARVPVPKLLMEIEPSFISRSELKRIQHQARCRRVNLVAPSQEYESPTVEIEGSLDAVRVAEEAIRALLERWCGGAIGTTMRRGSDDGDDGDQRIPSPSSSTSLPSSWDQGKSTDPVSSAGESLKEEPLYTLALRIPDYPDPTRPEFFRVGVIGPKGDVLRRIKSSSGCSKVDLDRGTDLLRLRGSEVAVRIAVRLVRKAVQTASLRGMVEVKAGEEVRVVEPLGLVSEVNSEGPVYKCTLRIPTHPDRANRKSFMAAIRGNNGDGLLKIRSRTGCSVVYLSRSTHLLYLRGSEAALTRARKLLEAMMTSLCASDGIEQRSELQIQVVESPRPVLELDNEEHIYETSLRIPLHPQREQGRSFRGPIIDKGGHGLVKIRVESGCSDVRVDADTELLHLCGSKAAVQRAVEIAQDAVRRVCERDMLELEEGAGWEVVEPLRPVFVAEGLETERDEARGRVEVDSLEAQVGIGVRTDGEGEKEKEKDSEVENEEGTGEQSSADDPEQLATDLKLTLRALTHPVVLVTALQKPSLSSTPAESSDNFDQRLAHCRGVTISSFTTVSLGPPNPYISFNLRVPSRTWDALSSSKNHFVVHILAASPQGAAIAHAFTQPFDDPGEPFARLRRLGATVWIRGRHDAPRIRWGSAVMALLRARMVEEKCVRVGDHVVVVAEVRSVRRLSSDLEQDEDGEEVAREGLAYAMRGYRGIGMGVEVLELQESGRQAMDSVDDTNDVEDGGEMKRGGVNTTATGVEITSPMIDEDDAATTRGNQSVRSAEETDSDYYRETNSFFEVDEAPGAEETAAAASIEDQEKRRDIEQEEYRHDLGSEPADHAADVYADVETMAGLGSSTVPDNSQEQRRDDDEVAKSSHGSSNQTSANSQPHDGNMGLKHWSSRPKDRLEPNLKVEYSTLSGPKYSSRSRGYHTVMRPYSTTGSATPRQPSSLVANPALLASTVGEFLDLPEDNTIIRPKRIRDLYRTREEAKVASLRLENGLEDGTLTSQESAELEQVIVVKERRMKTTLARWAAEDLRRMLDRGRVTDVRRAQWLESTIEQGQAVLLREASRLREALESGAVNQGDFAIGRQRLEREGAVLNTEVMRLRQMVEEDAEGAGEED